MRSGAVQLPEEYIEERIVTQFVIDPARKYYESRHSGPDPESSPNQQRRALNVTGYRLPLV
jgi:hypothetical protein